ncbi:MAG TPA: amidohydrolase family protein [Methylomirabilota bacterium]|nr:amidohydrolase family protein [Methylomirabilota bacterium]
MTRMLLRNGWVITMDAALGDIAGGDVLIEDDRIAAVGLHLTAEGATVLDATGLIVMPGLVNAHIHTWETGLRGIGADWVSARDYFGTVHGNLAQRYEAQDNYVANLLGALSQINGGTTTIFDWCHNLRSPDMTDAALDGLEQSGIRAVFGHGTAKPIGRQDPRPFTEIPQPRQEIQRLRTGRLAADDRLVTLALAILGPDWGTYEVAETDIRLAREYSVINSAHTFGRPGKRMVPDGMYRLGKAGLLGPDHNLVHGNCLDDAELRMIVDAGCSISATVTAEMLNCEQPALLGRVEKLGGLPSLGTDVDPYFAASMLAEMRRAFLHQRELDNRALAEQKRYPAQQHATTTRSALRWATLGGARALGLEHRIGSLTPGKQADLVMIQSTDLNIFPSVPLGDPVHAVVMNAESGNVDTVLIAGRIVKRHGQLTFPAPRIDKLKGELLASRERVMRAGAFVYAPVAAGPRP